MQVPWARGLICLWLAAMADSVWAGGSGLNVVIVVNQASSNSIALGNYYREQRQVPPQNVLRIQWTGDSTDWSAEEFEQYLVSPLEAMLASRQLTNQIDYVLLSMDIPYRVIGSASAAYNSTTSALFYGFKADPNPPCSMAPGSTNLYAGTEGIFRATPPSGGANSYLTTMITASNLASAIRIVDSGARCDSTFPTQAVYLTKSSDVLRNLRYLLFDNAIFNARLRGGLDLRRAVGYGIGTTGSLFGCQSGDTWYPLTGVSFVPGSLADNLTSYGGLLFRFNGYQLNMLDLLEAGAAGSYGTVHEPCNYLEKFPAPLNYFYQARGFTLAECYYLSVTNPYQGLVMGDPLAAPFAQPLDGDWTTPLTNALLSGTTNLSLRFSATSFAHPVQRVDLFLDGCWVKTLTNIPPAAGNTLQVDLNGCATRYSVTSNATLKDITAGLAAAINAAAATNASKVLATAYGDRLALQAVDRSLRGSQVRLSWTNAGGTAPLDTTFLTGSRTNFLDTVAYGRHNLVVNSGTAGPPINGSWLLLTITKTNGALVRIGATNDALTLTNLARMVSSLVNQVNTHPLLTTADGCAAEDFVDYSQFDPANGGAEFNLLARCQGWDAAQIQTSLTGSSPGLFSITPAAALPLEDNLADLQPRAHLYLSAGLTNLSFSFSLDTTAWPDGVHELAAVAYEGTHVRTQKRVTRTITIRNHSMTAALAVLYGGTNTAVDATLRFSVAADASNISRIELFSTGGLLASAAAQSTALFSIPGAGLGAGLHPFYAVITAANGRQYRTETRWIRLLTDEPGFAVTASAPPPRLTWPATAGRPYEILSATGVTSGFQVQASLTPSNSIGQWADTNLPAASRFYRVRTGP